jgi:hypothetical protein
MGGSGRGWGTWGEWVVDWVTWLKEYVPIDALGIELGAGFC